MSLEMDDLPVIETLGRLGRRSGADPGVADLYAIYRPETGYRLSSAVLSLGLNTIGRLQEKMFPTADQLAELQRLMQGGGSYTMYFDCGPYQGYGGTCNEACFGFPAHLMDPFYCATCAEQAADPTNNPSYNWHYVGSRGSIQYMDREPDVCAGRDAWKWTVGACGDCHESAVFRCHDGFKKYSNNTLDPTICQGLVSCDNRLTLC